MPGLIRDCIRDDKVQDLVGVALATMIFSFARNSSLVRLKILVDTKDPPTHHLRVNGKNMYVSTRIELSTRLITQMNHVIEGNISIGSMAILQHPLITKRRIPSARQFVIGGFV